MINIRLLSLSFAAASAIAILSSCESDIAYLGESYAPTANVECFYSSTDIKRPYKIMGKAIASPGVFADNNRFLGDIMNSARMNGADAILVESFNKIKTGQTSSWNSDGWAEGKKKEAWWSESGSANTQDTTTLQAHIYFIKYTGAVLAAPAPVQVAPATPPAQTVIAAPVAAPAR